MARERQAHVAEADDADEGLIILDAGKQRTGRIWHDDAAFWKSLDAFARHPAVPQPRSSGFSAGAVATGVDSGAWAVACEA